MTVGNTTVTSAAAGSLGLTASQGPGLTAAELVKFLAAAKSRVGMPYVWGGDGPNQFDCSGLVQWSLAQAGVVMPRVAADQAQDRPAAAAQRDRSPGDLLFYHTDPTAPSYISHVAIYLGDGQMLQAPEPGMDVQIVPADFGAGFAGAIRIYPKVAAAVAATWPATVRSREASHGCRRRLAPTALPASGRAARAARRRAVRKQRVRRRRLACLPARRARAAGARPRALAPRPGGRWCSSALAPAGLRLPACLLALAPARWPVPDLPAEQPCNHNYMSTDNKEQVSAAEKLRGWFTGRLTRRLAGWHPRRQDRPGGDHRHRAYPGPADGRRRVRRRAAGSLEGRSRRFREETRQQRIEIAHEAEHAFGRKVSWGVLCDGSKVMFTTFSVPVMTRLRQAERLVLDTLVDAGVARSRSDALAWCVRLVGEHEDSWLADLREALHRVEQVRDSRAQS